MKHLAPSIFREFACAAGACPDSCCRAGWEIVIDPETLARYRTLPGPDGDRIRDAVTAACESAVCAAAGVEQTPAANAEQASAAGDPPEKGEALLRQNEARVCVLLDSDGLCHAQRRFGHESLCRVCREYPRFHREFGNLTEHGISLSCPTAFALAEAKPPEWVEWEDDGPVVPNDLDPERYLLLREGRRLALRILEEENRPLRERLALIWELAGRLQRGLDGGKRAGKTACRRLGSPIGRKAVLRRYSRKGFRRGARAPREWARLWEPEPWIEVFAGLEILSPEWKNGLAALRCLVGIQGEASAQAARLCRLSPSETLAGDPDFPLQERYARYLWYSLYKYWLDAADDGLLLARVRRSFAMTLLGLEMDLLLPEDRSWLQRISREIEHCEENLQALLQASPDAAEGS